MDNQIEIEDVSENKKKDCYLPLELERRMHNLWLIWRKHIRTFAFDLIEEVEKEDEEGKAEE
jgi:hypothetical protein